MHLAHYLRLLHRAQSELAGAFAEAGRAHDEEPDIRHTCEHLAAQCARHAERLAPFVEEYGSYAPEEPGRLHSATFTTGRTGPLGLMRDLHDLYLMAAECDLVWSLIAQAAQGVRDEELLQVVRSCEGETSVQMLWLHGRMKQAAPQALVVAPGVRSR
jgi:hypothetical protein